MNKQAELLDRIQKLEDIGYVIVLKWDGEREKGKKTLLTMKPPQGLIARRDGDNIWDLLEDMLNEVELKKQ